jgi:hypothetical protein
MTGEPGVLSFVIFGTGRSGTTLVQRLCAELPDVWVPGETHFWNLADRARYRYEFPLRGRARAEAVDWILEELEGRNLPLTAGAFMDELRARPRRIGLWQLYEAMVAAMSPAVGVLGEKTPNHIAWWEHFARFQPHIKFLAVVRDPRAVLASQRRVPWGESDPYAAAERWLAHQRSLRDCTRLVGDNRCLVIRYEDLVNDTVHHHRAIAEFLGVAFEPQALTADDLDRHPLFSSEEPWKANATKEVTTARVDAWRDALDDDEVAVVESTCWPEMLMHGYQPVGSGAAPPPAPPPGPESREKVEAFRQWYAMVAALDNLPVY